MVMVVYSVRIILKFYNISSASASVIVLSNVTSMHEARITVSISAFDCIGNDAIKTNTKLKSNFFISSVILVKLRCLCLFDVFIIKRFKTPVFYVKERRHTSTNISKPLWSR